MVNGRLGYVPGRFFVWKMKGCNAIINCYD